MKDNLMIPFWWLQARYHRLRSKLAIRQIRKLYESVSDSTMEDQ